MTTTPPTTPVPSTSAPQSHLFPRLPGLHQGRRPRFGKTKRTHDPDGHHPYPRPPGSGGQRRRSRRRRTWRSRRPGLEAWEKPRSRRARPSSGRGGARWKAAAAERSRAGARAEGTARRKRSTLMSVRLSVQHPVTSPDPRDEPDWRTGPGTGERSGGLHTPRRGPDPRQVGRRRRYTTPRVGPSGARPGGGSTRGGSPGPNGVRQGCVPVS